MATTQSKRNSDRPSILKQFNLNHHRISYAMIPYVLRRDVGLEIIGSKQVTNRSSYQTPIRLVVERG